MHTKVKRLLLLTLALGLLVGAGTQLNGLQQMRKDYDLASEPVRGISPQVALATQMLGWGRGILIDILWIRLESLKNQDKYFELVQLADWACKLAPRFPKVWEFHAWNLAYNVSCRVDYLWDRWDWVWNGVKLLRDEGIRWNPNAYELYESLSWMMMHKIGQQDDNAHFFYKQQFAAMAHRILAGGGDRVMLEALASAAKTKAELLEDPMVARAVDECAALEFDLVERFFSVLATDPSVPDGVKDLVSDPRYLDAMKEIESFVRAGQLHEQFGLDATSMLRVMDEYGPFDWRSPYPHAIYWADAGLQRLKEFESRFYGAIDEVGREKPMAHEGDERYRGEEELYEWHEVQLNRLLYMGMQSLVMHGRVLFNTRGQLVADMGTDYRFADRTMAVFENASGRFGERFEEGIREGYQHFLSRGVIEFHFMGDPRKSRRYYDVLDKRFHDYTYEKNFDEYLLWKLRDYKSAMSFSDARRLLRAHCYQYWICIGSNADDKAQALESEALVIAEGYNEEAEDLRSTVRYKEIRESALVDILTGIVRISPDVLANLKYKLNEERPGFVDSVLARLEQQGTKPPELEDVDEEYKTEH